MPKGISLHLGLNSIDPNHYGGWSGPLVACENDAIDMELIAKSKGFTSSKLLTKQATRTSVLNQIRSAMKELHPGDIFLLSYSGHGGQLPDISAEESDGLDETWCLFDGQLVDDELYQLWAEFSADIRILVFSDSCHSGTVTKAASATQAVIDNNNPTYRCMPAEIVHRTYNLNKAFYDKILTNLKEPSVKAPVKLISGCQDNQLSLDGPFNGLFTGTLKRIWNGGKFQGNYELFHTKITLQMPSDQTPNLFGIGQSNATFDNQDPFTI